MKAMCPNLFTGPEHFPGSAQLLFPRSAECLTPQRVRGYIRVGPFARFLSLRNRCGLRQAALRRWRGHHAVPILRSASRFREAGVSAGGAL